MNVGKKLVLVSAVACLMTLGPADSEAQSNGAIALIDVHSNSNGIEIVGKALAVSDTKLSGSMTIERKGASGTVSTRQASNLDIKAGRTADIARVNVSYQAGDRLNVTVTLKRDGVVISESTLSTEGQ